MAASDIEPDQLQAEAEIPEVPISTNQDEVGESGGDQTDNSIQDGAVGVPPADAEATPSAGEEEPGMQAAEAFG